MTEERKDREFHPAIYRAAVSRRLFAAHALALLAFAPTPAFGQAMLVSVGWLTNAGKVMRQGSEFFLGAGAEVFGGDIAHTDQGSKLMFELSGGDRVSLGQNSRASLAVTGASGSAPRLAIRLESGLARFQQAQFGAMEPKVLQGRFARTWALAVNSVWFVRSTPLGSEVVVASGRIMLSHEYRYWRMVLDERTGMSRVPGKDVTKHRLPKPRAYPEAKISAFMADTQI
jgi:hypothetical protein